MGTRVAGSEAWDASSMITVGNLSGLRGGKERRGGMSRDRRGMRLIEEVEGYALGGGRGVRGVGR
jgi:hypothetical protein